MKILILVLSLHDSGGVYDQFFNTQKTTWDSIKIPNIETYYYFGNSIENKIVDNEIYVNVPEGLMNCGYKTLKCFETISNMEFDYILRTNSSSYIDKQLLLNNLTGKPSERFYSGVIGYYESVPFASGSGYVLSRDMVKLVVDNKNRWDHKYIDDVSLSKLLLSFGVTPVSSERFDVVRGTPILTNFHHYRLKSNDRRFDIESMNIIHNHKKML